MRRLLLICVALVATMLFSVSVANASYTRVLPNGLSSSPHQAKKQVQALVSNDSAIQSVIARDNGLAPSQVSKARVVQIYASTTTIGQGYDNSARSSTSGAVVPSSYMYGQTVASWTVTLRVSKSKTVTVRWKKDCSNPFLRKGPSIPPLRITTRSKSFVLPFSKTKRTKRVVKCPSGQQVAVTVVTRVKGRVRVRSLTRGVNLISQKLNAKLRMQVKNTIRVRCGKMPTLPPAQVNKCVAGQVIDSNGNCVNQTNTAKQECEAKGGTWNGDVQLCTIIQVNANCSNVIVINGSGNVVSNTQEGNCNSSPPPAKCPDGRPVPPEGCDNPPYVDIFNSPAHLYVNGIFYVFIEAWDSDGDDVSVSTSASGQGTITLPTPVGVRWDGSPCPADKFCYRARVQASNTPGSLTLTFTVRAGGKSETKSVTLPVVPDEF